MELTVFLSLGEKSSFSLFFVVREFGGLKAFVGLEVLGYFGCLNLFCFVLVSL